MDLQDQIKMYPLGNDGIKMLTSESQGGIITPITQIDFTEKDLVCGNSYLDIDEGYYPYSLNGIKLILRPISDLTEDEFSEQFYNTLVGNNETFGGIDEFESTIEYFADLDCETFLSCKLPHDTFEFMFKNKFDVFDLISQDKAIDINTIEP